MTRKAAAFVDHRYEFIAHQFVEFVRMHVNCYLAAGGPGQALIDAKLIDVARN